MNKLIISLAAAILSLPVAADEGMWLLPLLKGQRFPEMQALGLKLQDYDIYSPDSASLKDAVVIFGGGCTGEIVSPEGLLLIPTIIAATVASSATARWNMTT